jgi:hypothetical protein
VIFLGGDAVQDHSMLNPNSSCFNCSDLELVEEICRQDLEHACKAAYKAHRKQVYFLEQTVDSIKHIISSIQNYWPAIIVRIVAITATAPRLTPTITHRIQLGIYGSFKACQILFIVS